MLKRILLAALAASLLATSVVGCNKSKPSDNQNGTVELTIGGGRLERLTSDGFGKWLSEKTGVTFSIINMEGNDSLRLLASTNSLPDMVSANMGNSEFLNFAEQGLFKEVPEDLLKKFPINKADVEGNEVTQIFKSVLNAVYGIPHHEGEVAYNSVNETNLYYRADWVKKLGLKTPETVDDMYEMFKAFSLQDPDGNGQDDSYGISGTIWQVHMIPWVDTYGWVKEDGRWIPGYVSKAALEGLKFWNRVHSDGFMDPEFGGANTNPKDLFFASKVGTMYTNGDPYWTNDVYRRFSETTGSKNPYEDMKILAPGPKKDANSPAYWPSQANTTVIVFGDQISDEELEKALGLLEFMKGEEATHVRRWGFEGEDYKMVDGKEKNIFVDEETGRERPIWEKYESLNFMHFVSPDSDWSVHPDNNTFTKEAKNAYLQANAKYRETAFPDPVEIKYLPTDAKATYNYNFSQQETDYSTIISAEPEEVEPMFNELVDKLNSTYDLQAVIDSVNQAIQEKGLDK